MTIPDSVESVSTLMPWRRVRYSSGTSTFMIVVSSSGSLMVSPRWGAGAVNACPEGLEAGSKPWSPVPEGPPA